MCWLRDQEHLHTVAESASQFSPHIRACSQAEQALMHASRTPAWLGIHTPVSTSTQGLLMLHLQMQCRAVTGAGVTKGLTRRTCASEAAGRLEGQVRVLRDERRPYTSDSI
jgi:hypothetical protein